MVDRFVRRLEKPPKRRLDAHEEYKPPVEINEEIIRAEKFLENEAELDELLEDKYDDAR